MAERILIVEDEEALRESMNKQLSREGYEVDGVASCSAAFERIECSSYDMVIADIMLPGVSGVELLKRCRESHPNLVVLIITAFASIETAVEAMRAGAYDYIVKPVAHEELMSVVRNALRDRPSIS
jgi:two-component system response regulator PilR (NtrC family)